MSYIASLLVSLDTRLDELTAEIDRLETARTALQRSAAYARDGAAGTRARRSPRPRKAAERVTPEPARDKPARIESVPKAPKARRSPAPRARRARRPAATLRPADLERLLAAADTGLSASAIAEQAGARYQATLGLLRELETSGQVRREGSRRSTVWRLVSDEERIAERAAELERLATSRS